MPQTVNASVHFLSKSFFGLGIGWFWIPFSVLVITLLVAFWHSEPLGYWKYGLLTSLPAMWILVVICGFFFRVRWEESPVVLNARWVLYLPAVGFLAFLGVGVVLIVYLRSARGFVAAFVAINLLFMALATLWAEMMLSGDAL